jgi:hypothetical protein
MVCTIQVNNFSALETPDDGRVRLKHVVRRKRDSTGYWLESRVGFPAWQNYSFLHSVQIESWAHTTSCPMVKGGDFTGGEAAET